MAITKLPFPTPSTPSETPDIETDYNKQNEYIEGVLKGYNGVSLNNWDATTTAPTVASGSAIESNGSLYQASANEAISTVGASSGTVYLILDESALEYVWTNTTPTWSATKNGWYVSTDRFTGHLCTWDGAAAFSEKRQLSTNVDHGDAFSVGHLGFAVENTAIWEGAYDTESISAGGNWVIPAGAYMFAGCPATDALILEMKNAGGVFITSGEYFGGGFVVSDGSSYRIRNSSVSIENALYRKVW